VIAVDEAQAQAMVDQALGEGYFLVPCPQGWFVVAEARPGRTAVGSQGNYVVSVREQALIGFPAHLSVQRIKVEWTAVRARGWVQASLTAA
jgi:hypothetical protein